MHDKREHPRVEEKNRVTVTVLQAPEAPQLEHCRFYCWTHDLSQGGLKFCVHSAVPIGALLKLEIAFQDPDAHFVHFGRVMWAQPFDEEGIVSIWLGVKFSETVGGPDRQALWAELVDRKLHAQ